MSENKQNQGGMGKDIMRLIMKNKIVVVLLILTIISGILFFNLYSNARNTEVPDADAEKQAFLNELTGGQQEVSNTKESKKTDVVIKQENEDAEDVQFSGSTDVQNAAMTENPIIAQENDYYKIEIVGAEIKEDKIMVNVKYQVKENLTGSEIDNDLIYLSTSKTYLATSAGNLPLQEIMGVGLLPLEDSLQNYGKKDIDDFLTYISNIKSESRIPTAVEIQGTLIFKKPENYTTNSSCKIKLVTMPLAINNTFGKIIRGSYDEYKDKLFIKPYPWYLVDYIFEDMLDVNVQSQE